MAHRLEALIGKNGLVEERQVEIVEVLYDKQEIILREVQARNALLKNQYGEITRKTRQTYTISFFNANRDDCHPVLKTILNLEEQQLLLDGQALE